MIKNFDNIPDGWKWPVAKDYEIRDGEVRAVGISSLFYNPYDEPDLPVLLAKMSKGDEDDILEFTRSWGLLGYKRYAPSSRDGFVKRGADMAGLYEPLDWTMAHARGVQIAKDLLAFMKSDKNVELAKFLSEIEIASSPKACIWKQLQDEGEPPICEVHEDELPAEGPAQGSRVYYFTCGIKGQIKSYVVFGELHNDKAVAWAIFKYIVGNNISAMSPVPISGGKRNSMEMPLRYEALSDVIYWHLGDMAAHDLGFRQCLHCRDYFVPSDGRQKYCPPPRRGRAESSCAINARVRRHRKKKGVGKNC